MRHVARRGFTLIELLVVLGIIVLLAAVLLPMVNHAYSHAIRASIAADLQIISQALEAYKYDFGDYPRLDRIHVQPQKVIGAPLLCWALVAPGPAGDGAGHPFGSDGADGPGFRLRGTVGPVKGPYLPPDRFRIGTINWIGVVQPPGMAGTSPRPANFNDAQDVLADRNYSPILYFAATRGAVATSSPNGFVSPVYVAARPSQARSGAANPAVFTFDDNHVYLDLAVQPSGGDPGHPGGNSANLTRGADGWKVMSYRLGDTNFNGVIDAGETPITTGPYLLWSAGPDAIFGNDDDVMCDGAQLQQVTGPLPLNMPH